MTIPNDPKGTLLKDSVTIGELASSFGWSTRFVEGLVRGERLPSIEVDGQLRFRRDEIVDWLQQKIHTLDSARVSDLEGNLESNLLEDGTFATRRSDRLASRLPLKGIALDLEIGSKQEVLRTLVDLADATGLLLDRDFLLASLVDREALCSTALPGGVALCHPRRPVPSAISRQFVCFLRTRTPVDFGAEDGEGTSLFFLLCTPDDRSHLHGLARLARVLHKGGLTHFQNAETAEDLKNALATLEGSLES